MAKKIHEANAEGFARLVILLVEQADTAIEQHKLTPERRDELMRARKELPILSTNMIEAMGGGDGATTDVWGLISAVCLIMDPDAHKADIADTIREADNKKKNQDLLESKNKKFAVRQEALRRAIAEELHPDKGELSQGEYRRIWKATQRNLGVPEDVITKNFAKAKIDWPSRSVVQRAVNGRRKSLKH